MKKIISLTMIAIFLFSLVPLAFAQDASAETEAGTAASAGSADSQANARLGVAARGDAREDVRDKREDVRDKRENLVDASNIDRQRCINQCQKEGRQDCTTRCKAADKREDAKDKRENVKDRLEDAREKNRERLAKIQNLDSRQIERLSALDVKHVEKIEHLKKERLDRLANLDEEKLKRVAELEEKNLEKVSDLEEKELHKLASLNRARLKELANHDEARLKAELKAIHVVRVKNADDLGRKNLTQAELTKLRERHDKAKEEFKHAKDELNEERKALKEAHEKRDEKASLEHAKNYLLRVAEALTNHLEKLKAKVQENKNIADDEEAKIVAEIDAKIAEVAEIKAEVEAAATKEHVKEASKKLREMWSKLKHIIDLHAKRVVAARVEGIVHRGLVLEKKLDHVLEKAKEKGIEVDVSAEISMFSEKIALSKDKHTQAQAKLSEALDLRSKGEAADSDKIKSLMNEANQLLKESRDALKEAHDVLKTILKKIKDAVPEADLSADVEVEVEQEAEASA